MVEPTRAPAKKRRWKRFLIGIAGGLFVLLLAYPFWLPWVLKPVVVRLGVHFQRCQRHGYARFEFSDVDWTNGSTAFQAGRVLVQMPHRFLWSRLSGASPLEPRVRVSDWRLEISPPAQSAGAQRGSTSGLLTDLQPPLSSVVQWLDWVVLTNGEVHLAAKSYPIDAVTLRQGRLQVTALGTRATVDLTSLAASSLSLSLSNQQGRAEAEMKQDEEGWGFDGGVFWQSNRFDLNGRFDRTNWLPAIATLSCDSLRVPSGLLGLGKFTDLRGNAQAGWTNGGYRFNVDLSNSPRPGEGSGSELVALRMKGIGDLRSVRIDHLDLESPLATATLEHPLTLDYSGRVRQGSSALRMWADLGRIESVPLTGRLSGELTLRPVTRSLFRGRFSLRGTGVEGFGVKTKTLDLEGLVDWPRLDLSTIKAQFPFGGTLSASLALNVNERRLQDLEWHLEGNSLNSLPGQVRVDTLRADGSASGVWPDLSHTGRVEVAGIRAGALQAESANLEWSGRKLSLDRFSTTVNQGPSSLALTGSGELTTGTNGLGASFTCNELEFTTPEEVWQLKEPVRFSLLRHTNALELNLSPLELAGPGTRLSMQASVTWPSKGSGRLALHGLRSRDLRPFLSSALPELRVPDAAFSLSWDHGPVRGELDAEAQWQPGTNLVWTVNAHATADGQTLRFDPVRVDLGGAPCAELSGTLPLRFEPTNGWNVADAGSAGEAHLDLRVRQKGPIWSLLEKKAGLQVDSPTAAVRVRGQLANLRGELVLNAARLQWGRSNVGSAFNLPPVERLHLDATAGLDGVQLRQLKARVFRQDVAAKARWRIDASDGKEWLEAVRKPDWKRVTGSLRMPNAELSALAALAPGVIAPIGVADLDLTLDPGLRVNGHLTITNGATRFLKPVGALRSISADIALEGWNATLKTFTAALGGQPVQLSGDVAWRPDGDRQMDLRLQGKNLSLLRNPDLFVRADLHLHLQKQFGEVARLSGDVELRRSLLLRDFNSFVHLDLERPEQRPPYFSIPEPPFGGWHLDVQVKGDHFLNVISPAFKGEVSAGLQLQGTLREPLAIGAVTVDQGKILFPFGTVDIENGRVDLTRQDPYRPHLDFRGEGQNFGYTISVELTGPVDAPNLTFQSVPPLTAQQILLMLTAGEIPNSNFSYSSTDKATRAGIYIGKEFVNRFIGNTSASERLSFRSGQNITDQGKPTYLLEYRLTDRWSVFGEYDRFQDLNSGIKFKVLSK